MGGAYVATLFVGICAPVRIGRGGHAKRAARLMRHAPDHTRRKSLARGVVVVNNYRATLPRKRREK